MGLNSLAEVVLHQSLSEKQSASHKIRRSNWEAETLSGDQLQYAANKALVALDIFRESTLSKMRGNRSGETVSDCGIAFVEETWLWLIR